MALRREVGHLQAEMDALWAMTKRNLAQAARNGVPGPGRSVVKVVLLRAAASGSPTSPCACSSGPACRVDDVGGLAVGHFVEERLRITSFTIAAGTSQIQRNIIAERILGLPRA